MHVIFIGIFNNVAARFSKFGTFFDNEQVIHLRTSTDRAEGIFIRHFSQNDIWGVLD